MARTIQSPGVEINEIDLSLVANLPVGTNVFVTGFAAQGPTHELVNVTSQSELEQIYGLPNNVGERYFHHTCKEVLNSPANLLVSRLPYGLSSGDGYDGGYSALLYPVSGNISSYTDAVTSTPTYIQTSAVGAPVEFTSFDITINYDLVTQLSISAFANHITTNAFIMSIPSITTAFTLLSTWTGTPSETHYIQATYDGIDTITIAQTAVNTTTSLETELDISYRTYSTEYSDLSSFAILEPKHIALTEDQYNSLMAGTIDWSTKPTNTNRMTSYDYAGEAGFIVLNKLKTTVDSIYEGYYVAITDNADIDTVDYDDVKGVKFAQGSNPLHTWSNVPVASYSFSLSGNGSVSEMLEKVPTIDITQSDYNDSIIVGLYKLRPSVYNDNPNILTVDGLAKSFYGSLNANKKQSNVKGGAAVTDFIGAKINDDGTFLHMLVNPNLSLNANWSNTGLVRINRSYANMYALGNYIPTVGATASKDIGNVVSKLETTLMLAENTEQTPIDIVCEAGLGTLWVCSRDATNANDSEMFKETDDFATEITALCNQSTGSSSNFATHYRSIYNQFLQFCSTTRKDCLYVADALRHIFVQGEDYKTLNNKTKNFSSNIYWPLKNQFSAANSSFACTYGNWVKNYDNNSAKMVWLPMSGYVANIMARVSAQYQPWWAPAGLNNGILRNVVDIAVNPTQRQRDLLYKISINPVMFSSGDGFVVWGQKTLQKKPSAFDRINVRRLFLTLEKATILLARYFVFEPNTIFTRTRLINILKPIFEIAKNNEGCYDYMIVCDERNNLPNNIDNNELIVDIYIKPVRTAEYILVNFYATRTDQNFSELV